MDLQHYYIALAVVFIHISEMYIIVHLSIKINYLIFKELYYLYFTIHII